MVWARIVCCVTLSLVLIASPLSAQQQSRVQYSYDPAGNLIQVVRSTDAPKGPDLTVSNFVVGSISVNGNGSFNIPVTFQVNNIGALPALATWYDRGYLSPGPELHDTDQPLGGYNTRTTNLAAGASYSVATTFTTNTLTPPGNYTLVVKADGGAGTAQFSPTGANLVVESNETNNTQLTAISLLASPKPDLTLSNVIAGKITAGKNGKFSVPLIFTVTNAGGAAALPSWYDLVYLSRDAVLDDADQNLSGHNLRRKALPAGASYTVTTTYTSKVATASGKYTLFIKTDGRGAAIGIGTNTDSGAVTEGNEANNLFAMPVVLP